MTARLIPVLLLDSRRRLVKTVRFGERTYIGDPFNVLRLFNEKEVDEVIVLDIDASHDRREPDYGFLRELAAECFMPVAYGGGLVDARQCEQVARAGIEKVVLGHSAYDSALIRLTATELGSQSVVACVDAVAGSRGYRCRGREAMLVQEHCARLVDAGVGELVVQSVERDGTRQGYDLDLIRATAKISVPIVALGGAGSLAHLLEGIAAGAAAAASGSAFTFIGRLRAVLISYPTGAAAGLTT
jgi:imidazole glycerol-phosphate synthase subunit HisF